MAPKRLRGPPAASSSSEEHSSPSGEEEGDSPPPPPARKSIRPASESKTLAPPEQHQSSDDDGTDSPLTVKAMGREKVKDRPKPWTRSSSKAGPAGEGREGKRAKKEEGTEKKAPFQRVWSEEDEIVLLKGMVEYSKMEGGGEPSTQIDEFKEFIAGSIGFSFSRSQLVEKMKRLKKKHRDWVEKGKKGSSPHELESFDLADKLWGDEVLVVGVSTRKTRNVKKGLASESKIVEDEDELGMSLFKYQGVLDGLQESNEEEEMEKKVRKLKIAELELYLERKALIGEQAKMLLAHYKSLD